jgi:hypothetical protein
LKLIKPLLHVGTARPANELNHLREAPNGVTRMNGLVFEGSGNFFASKGFHDEVKGKVVDSIE